MIHERACFYQRVQHPGEKAETFIRTLYDLLEHCDFGEHRDEQQPESTWNTGTTLPQPPLTQTGLLIRSGRMSKPVERFNL